VVIVYTGVLKGRHQPSQDESADLQLLGERKKEGKKESKQCHNGMMGDASKTVAG
jgi:hypothetical protein